jgi:hypothetical protein
MEFPTTMLDFMHQFPDEKACRAYLEKMGWPNGFVCSRCQGTNASYVASRRLRQCAACNRAPCYIYAALSDFLF